MAAATRRLFIAAAALLLVAPAEAQAARMTTFVQAQQVAASYFPPPCGPVVLHWTDTRTDGTLVHAQDGSSEWGAFALREQCRVVFSFGSWRWTGWNICTIMVHEYGHLAGFQHSDALRSIMFPGPIFTPKRCRAAFARPAQ